ncbi:MAG: hypothetical protein K2K70_06240 [Lachnospiraceae bacterium]|nr:hypothetical protein [Lachnospiraceae bacterium]
MCQNREYKSDLFSMLMDVPEYALEVYNVLNDSCYNDPSQIQIMKLEKGVLLSIRNDASFLLDSYLNLYEHQSTYNPNMPLRFLIYFSNLMLELIKKQEYDLFGRKQIPIPTPKFVVFYNGIENRPDREEMRLSDAYEHQEERYKLDLQCVAYNINPGYNEHIQKNSRVLSGYTTFVEKVRRYAETESTLKDAVRRAVDECIGEDILTEFFRKHRREVVEMAALDFTFERREKLIRRDSLEEGLIAGRQEGLIAGRQEGEKIGLLKGKIELLNEMQYSISEIAAKLAVSEQKVQEILQQND